MIVNVISVLVPILTLIVLSWTLVVVRRYAHDTKILAATSVEQLPRPCVVLQQYVDSSGMTVLTGETTSLIGDQHYGSHLIFMNVGTGPAVNCRYRASDIEEKREGEPPWFRLPEIGPSDSFESLHTLNSLPSNAAVSIEYESVAGSSYRTDLIIEGRKWVREAKFTGGPVVESARKNLFK